jgi:anionic cell wall polymer biosynthesis LytR-Cps2A-Psr (LCP) family protein
VVRQQVFLRGLLTKLAGSKNLDQLMAAVRKDVLVDPAWNVVEFANQVASGATMATATIPYTNADVRTPDNGSALGVDPPAVKEFVAKFLAGSGPGPGSGGSGSGGSGTGGSGAAEVPCVS